MLRSRRGVLYFFAYVRPLTHGERPGSRALMYVLGAVPGPLLSKPGLPGLFTRKESEGGAGKGLKDVLAGCL